MATGLFLFQNDLRLHDNPALRLAVEEVDKLICVYCIPSARANRYPYTISIPAKARWQFLLQSLKALSDQLLLRNQQLLIALEHPLNILPELITRHNVSAIYSSEHVGTYEQRNWQTLMGRYPYIQFRAIATHSLFDRAELPFELNQLPATFSKFHKLVKDTPVETPIGDITEMPPRPKDVAIFDVLSPLLSKKFTSEFNGGETAGLEQMANYFASSAPSKYKETRNGLDGWDYSTKFSPWLALGCLSAKSVLAALAQYQQAQGEQSGSSDWIKYELMWREYFQWYGHKYGHRLFQFRGIKDSSPNTAFYPERFRRWCEGNTPYPLVNALMNQLRQTGYMSNRGRQIAASCLTNELSLDWRYGASYFEEHLIDYDIASNWGNWQYLAGVGADPKGHRHFNIEKQTDYYDPDRTFINKWGGNKFDGGLDSVDAADWPIY